MQSCVADKASRAADQSAPSKERSRDRNPLSAKNVRWTLFTSWRRGVPSQQ